MSGLENLTTGQRLTAPSAIAPAITSIALSSAGSVIGQGISVEAIATGNPTPELSYQWQAGGVDIDPAISTTFTPTAAQEGATIRCVVTATNAAGADVENSLSTTATIYEPPVAVGSIPPISENVSATAYILDVSPYFEVFADDDLEGVAWSVTGDRASVADPSAPFVTLDVSTAATASVFNVTATNSGGSASQTASVTAVSADTTPPLLSGAVNTFTQLGYTSNESDGTFFWMVDDNATRTALQVEAGGGDASGSFAVTGGAQTPTADLSAISGTKRVHAMHKDAAGNRSAVITSTVNFIVQDVTAPALSDPAVSRGATTAQMVISTDEGNGAIWWLVDGNASRTAAQIKAAGTSRAVTSTGAQAAMIVTGLTAETGYNFHVMHEDAEGNQSSVYSEAFTTLAAAAGVVIEQAVTVVTSTADLSPYTGTITIGAAANRSALAIVHGYNTDSSSADPSAGTVTITLDGDAMTVVNNPALAPSARTWAAMYWIAAPDTGELTFSLSVGRSQRAMAVTIIELSNAAQTDPVAFVAANIANPEGNTLAAIQDFPSRALESDGNLLIASIAVDTGSAAIPAVRGGTLENSGQTGSLATSDVTFAVGSRDSSGQIGFAMDATRKAILQMIEVRAA